MQKGFKEVMVFGPVLGYVEQFKMVKKTNSVGSFSIDICAILLISNILRIFYWFEVGFGTPLLLQAFLMIAAQIMLLKACVEANQSQHKNNDDGMRSFIQDMFSLAKFWRWEHFQFYVRFLVGMTTTVAVLTLIFTGLFKSRMYGEMLGYLSLSIEAMLGLPQLLKNYQAGSTAGLSLSLILSWLIGDLLKTVYFVVDGQPLPFIMCGSIQITVDILILLQMFFYGRRPQAQPYDPVKDM